MIDLRLSVAGHPQTYSGSIAGQRTLSSLACAHLAAGESAEAHTAFIGEYVELPSIDGIVHVVINAELEAQPVSLQALHTQQRSYFTSHTAAFWVDADGHLAALTRCTRDPVPWLFGPVLILALARLGIYCLHASAFLEGNTASVFVGHSGAGKSCLARAASSRQGTQRLCDDITPITLRAGKLFVLPQFPQLKLTAPDQNLPESVPLKRLVVLRAAQAGHVEHHQALSDREIFAALTHHTVATRLYSENDTRAWWQMLPQLIAALDVARAIQPRFDTHAPEHAMLAALDALDALCG